MTEPKERTLGDLHHCPWSKPASGGTFSGQNEGSHQLNAEAVVCSSQDPFPHPFPSVKSIAFHTCLDTCIFNKTIWLGWKRHLWSIDPGIQNLLYEEKREFVGAMQAREVRVSSHSFWKGIIIRDSKNKFLFTLIDNGRAYLLAVQHNHTVYKWPPNSGN